MSFSMRISCQILGLLAALLLTTVSTQNCANPTEEKLKCFKEAGVKINEKEFRIAMEKAKSGGGSQVTGDLLQKDLGAVCRKIGEKEKELKAYQCQMDFIGKCLASLKDVYTSVDSMTAYLDSYCQQEKEIDSDCFHSKSGEIQTCSTNKVKAYELQHGRPTDLDGVRELICEFYSMSSTCQRTELRSCDNSTRTILNQLNGDYLSAPEACLGVAWVPSLFMTLLLAMVTARLF